MFQTKKLGRNLRARQTIREFNLKLHVSNSFALAAQERQTLNVPGYVGMQLEAKADGFYYYASFETQTTNGAHLDIVVSKAPIVSANKDRFDNHGPLTINGLEIYRNHSGFHAVPSLQELAEMLVDCLLGQLDINHEAIILRKRTTARRLLEKAMPNVYIETEEI